MLIARLFPQSSELEPPLIMCGICGLVGASPLTPDELERVRAVNAAMFHRGPDGSGEDVSSQVMIAMRRLSIIDLTGGWQPLFNEDKSIALVANGEIYNFVELRRELEGKGHVFRTNSDCETAIHAYEEFGLDFVHKLRGMFSLAINDTNRRRVILARDRMGEKPLFLFESPGRILFASELKSILASGMIRFDLDPVSINDYFHFQYVPDPATPVVGVRKLPAGHMLIIDIDPWRVEQRCYWRMDDAPPLTGDPKNLIREQLEQIGELIIRSDVPVGVALSAGLDSSTVAALSARKSKEQVHALTIGYRGRPHNDERSRARALAEHLRMPFHECEIAPEEVADAFEERVFMRDDPIADISGHGYWAASRLARQKGIPVLLQGQGVDELFWGYSWVRDALRSSMCKSGRLPVRWRDRLGYFRKLFPMGTDRASMRFWAFHVGGLMSGWRPVRAYAGLGPNVVEFYNLADEFCMGRYISQRLLDPAFRDRTMSRSPTDWFTVPQPWPDLGVLLTKLICQTYLLENGLQQGDRLSMSWAVELRMPFVDHRFVETAIGLRKANPDHMLPPKARFREVVKDLLPDWVMNRPKSGFTPPIMDWTRTLNARYGQRLRDGYLVSNGVIDPRAIPALTRPHSRFSAWTGAVYKTLVLEWWARGMASAAQFKPASQILANPKPALANLLTRRTHARAVSQLPPTPHGP